jgi:hypothetical protein
VSTPDRSRGGVFDVAPTMAAGLHGAFIEHPPVDVGQPREEDAYSLFYGRSAAMGWLTEATTPRVGEIWGMNEAEIAPSSETRTSRVAWFQVVRTHPAPDGVPVQAILACIESVMERLGRLRLDAIQLLLPDGIREEGLMTSPAGARTAKVIVQSENWFTDVHPSKRTVVRVTVSGDVDGPPEQAAAITDWLDHHDMPAFQRGPILQNHSTLPPDPLSWAYPEGSHRVTFTGSLAEWSLVSLGWLAALIHDGSRRNGFSGFLQLAITRCETSPEDAQPKAGPSD